MAALVPTLGMYHSSAPKAALAAASEALRAEAAPGGVCVVTVPARWRPTWQSPAVDRHAKDPTKGLPVGNTTQLA